MLMVRIWGISKFVERSRQSPSILIHQDIIREIRGKLHIMLRNLEQMDVVLTDLFDMSTLHNLNNISIDAKAFNQILKTNKI